MPSSRPKPVCSGHLHAPSRADGLGMHQGSRSPRMLPTSPLLAASGPPWRQLGACRLPPPHRAPGMSQLFGGAARGQANPNPHGWESERQMWANFLA